MLSPSVAIEKSLYRADGRNQFSINQLHFSIPRGVLFCQTFARAMLPTGACEDGDVHLRAKSFPLLERSAAPVGSPLKGPPAMLEGWAADHRHCRCWSQNLSYYYQRTLNRFVRFSVGGSFSLPFLTSSALS